MNISIFKHRLDNIVGIHSDGLNLYVARLELLESAGDVSAIVESDEVIDVEYVFDVDEAIERWTLIEVLETPLDELESDAELENRAEAIADKVSVLCSTRGWAMEVMALCLEGRDVVIDVEDLSSVPEAELGNAVRYRIAAAGAFDVDDFYSSYVERDGRVWMEGISKAAARTWCQAWRRNEMELLVLTAMPDGVDAFDGLVVAEGIDVRNVEHSDGALSAIYVARLAAYQSRPNFLSKELRRLVSWDFRKFAAVLAACSVLGVTGLFALDRMEYNRAAADLMVVRREFEGLERDRRMQSFIERELDELDGRRQVLASLSKEVFPWRSVLIHFGTIHVGGVWLTEIRGGLDKTVEIKGEALSYAAMSEYIKALEADREFFRREPEILSSTATATGRVTFAVRLSVL